MLGLCVLCEKMTARLWLPNEHSNTDTFARICRFHRMRLGLLGPTRGYKGGRWAEDPALTSPSGQGTRLRALTPAPHCSHNSSTRAAIRVLAP
jgi:hypothetical protein